MKVTDMEIGEIREFSHKKYIAEKRVEGNCRKCSFYLNDEICLKSVHVLGYCSIGREDRVDIIFSEDVE